MTDVALAQNTPTFSLNKIYVKDISLEIPHAPSIFWEIGEMKTEIQLHSQAVHVQESIFEVEVMATVTSKMGEKVMFLIEVKQAGLFQISNVPANELEPILAVMCPNILFPYLRTVVSDISVRGGFTPVLLNPVNFEDIYLQKRRQVSEAASATTH